ncbi:alpha/beta hydrolase fold domain-containing protein [Streptomyces sp. NPDC102381]|uniref:alpha/beta hydrolase fold domain-containing protein n=1 Tax=Streptomyces sp. NPDC102381 TaxID=3366164 RepID=UPI0037F68CEB
MPLDPFLAAKLHLLDGLDLSHRETSPETARRFTEFERDPADWKMPDIDTEDRSIPGPHGPIPLRVYTPKGQPRGAAMWLHGGGFAAGDLDMPEAHTVAAELCVRAQLLVVSVDYRLAAHGTRYPIPVDDAHAAWQWLVRQRSGPIALGGASAGAAIALSTALRLRDRKGPLPAALLLAYPLAHFPVPALDDESAAAMRELPPALRCRPDAIEAMVRTYTGRVSHVPQQALPGAADLTGLPPAGIVLSEFDDLRPSGELLARQLQESNVAVSIHLAAGMPHGHLNRTPTLKAVDASLSFLAGWV